MERVKLGQVVAGRWLEHEGFISGLLRMVAIKLPLNSPESSSGKG